MLHLSHQVRRLSLSLLFIPQTPDFNYSSFSKFSRSFSVYALAKIFLTARSHGIFMLIGEISIPVFFAFLPGAFLLGADSNSIR